MGLNIIKYFLTKNRCYIKNQKREEEGIQIHSIGTGQGTAKSVADYWNQSAVSACVNYIVDCDELGKVFYTLPEDVYSWADGGFGNRNLITIEICESDFIKYTGGANYTVLDSKKFKEDILRGYKTAVLLCADICKRHGWNPMDKLENGLYLISSHDEGREKGVSTAHVDPDHIWDRFGLSMDGFRKAVAELLAGKVTDPPVGEVEELYRVRKTWTDVDSQLFAGTLEGAKAACIRGYSVYDENGKAVYSLKVDGFQAADLMGLTEAERIERIAPLYQDNMRKTGMLASVGIAQFCLESGYGKTDLAEFANNLHGMKKSLSGNTWEGSVWDGVSVYGKESPEVYNGVTKMVYSEFRKYPNCETSIADRAAYFLNAMDGSAKRYPGIVGNKDYKSVINIIKAGKYATDPNYVAKLVNIVERWELFKYDNVEIPEAGESDILPETEQPWYRVRLEWGTTMKGQIGAYHDIEQAKKKVDENPRYKVFDESGNVVYEIKQTEYKVQVGSFSNKENAEKRVKELAVLRIDSFIFEENKQYKVQAGSYALKQNATNRAEQIENLGFKAIIKEY